MGAGAAGLATAIFTRRLNPSRQVVVLESARRPGAKILVSGGSRCNVTNRTVTERDFWGGRRTIIGRVLRVFTIDETVAFFRELGVSLHAEADGKLFPDSNRARDVLDALLQAAARAGAELITDRRVTGIDPTGAGFRISTSRGPLDARRVVLATGGQSLPKSGSDGAGFRFAERLGHTIVRTTPGLVPLTLAGETDFHRELSGVSHDAELTLWVDETAAIRLRGSLLWTHFGISGPVALNMSRHWLRATLEGHRTALTLSFFPGLTFDAVDAGILAIGRERPRASIEAALASLTALAALKGPPYDGLLKGSRHDRVRAPLPASAARAAAAGVGIDPSAVATQLRRDDRRRLARALVEWPLPVSGTRGYNHAEVTAGGVELTEIDPSTMESRLCPGLFLVGEVLDVDGRIGGFNFQWAWSSARAAARGLSTP